MYGIQKDKHLVDIPKKSQFARNDGIFQYIYIYIYIYIHTHTQKHTYEHQEGGREKTRQIKVFIHTHARMTHIHRYNGDKNIITFGGDHNSPRPAFFFDSVGIFFHNVLIHNHEPDPAQSKLFLYVCMYVCMYVCNDVLCHNVLIHNHEPDSAQSKLIRCMYTYVYVCMYMYVY